MNKSTQMVFMEFISQQLNGLEGPLCCGIKVIDLQLHNVWVKKNLFNHLYPLSHHGLYYKQNTKDSQLNVVNIFNIIKVQIIIYLYNIYANKINIFKVRTLSPYSRYFFWIYFYAYFADCNRDVLLYILVTQSHIHSFF